MKLFFAFLLLSSIAFGQSKKKQIESLNKSLDSINYVIDTERKLHKDQIEKASQNLNEANKKSTEKITEIKNTLSLSKQKIQVLNNKVSNYSMKIEKLTAEKENAISSLTKINLEKTEEFKKFKDSLKSESFLFSLSNGARPLTIDDEKKTPVEVQIGLYINSTFYIIKTYNDISWSVNNEEDNRHDSFLFKHKKGNKEGTDLSFNPDDLGWRSISLEYIDNEPYIIETNGGGDMENQVLLKVNFDINNNLDLIQIFNAEIMMGENSFSCISGNCDYKNYLNNKYSD